MASRRMISTRFFKDPDIMNLSKDTQLILIGLVLAADDEGREVAHAGLLGREIDYPAEQIEDALLELATNDLLVLYQVGKHRYYQLAQSIRCWQTLGGRITPSRYPVPPASDIPESERREGRPGDSQGKGGEQSGKTRGNSRDFPMQDNSTEENRTEDGENPTRKVLPFPHPPSPPSADAGDGFSGDGRHTSIQAQALTQHIARILTLPVTDALTRLVTEYAQAAPLSLPGEADAAREWIDDPQRNTKGRSMSFSFFRNWLKRELEGAECRQAVLRQSHIFTGTGGPSPSYSSASLVGRRPPDLMHLADEDRQAERLKGENR